jgi:hypothetical protein
LLASGVEEELEIHRLNVSPVFPERLMFARRPSGPPLGSNAYHADVPLVLSPFTVKLTWAASQ